MSNSAATPVKSLKYYGSPIGGIPNAIAKTIAFQLLLLSYVFRGTKYMEPTFFKDDKWAKVQIYSLAVIFKLWSQPHYRSPSFQQDMIDNLRNVAIPGTGIPLSWFCYSYWTCLFYILILNPLICLCGAVNKVHKMQSVSTGYINTICEFYLTHLLHPDDWFSFWRMNCRLVSYHSLLTQSPDYRQEDKWTFLTQGKALGVPISPFFDDLEVLVCKNKNIEGGMGIHFYKNAANGGDWILQEKLFNASWLNALLPPNAPLSTMRVITTCTYPLNPKAAPTANETTTTDNSANTTSANSYKDFVRAESGLLRLGRANASTDHSSVLFDVDINSGKIKSGTSNAHWYQLGLAKATSCPWLPDEREVTCHPDAPYPEITGQVIPDIQNAMDIVVRSHFKMMPNVPIVGWDVAFTTKGVVLLEVNLSCNFFKGTFDIPRYIYWVDEYWSYLEKLELKSLPSDDVGNAFSSGSYSGKIESTNTKSIDGDAKHDEKIPVVGTEMPTVSVSNAPSALPCRFTSTNDDSNVTDDRLESSVSFNQPVNIENAPTASATTAIDEHIMVATPSPVTQLLMNSTLSESTISVNTVDSTNYATSLALTSANDLGVCPGDEKDSETTTSISSQTSGAPRKKNKKKEKCFQKLV